MKFTPENEVVLFELSLLDNKSNIELASGIKKMSGAIISITIIDKGPGIAKEHLSHIFDRFYQVDVKQNRKFEGTGLGLSLSKELVELHHGSIQVESKPDMGSTFRVFLPIEKQAYRQNEIVDFSQKSDNETGQNEGRISLSEPIEESQATDSSTEDKIQMLIVEDNPEMRAYITDYFKTSYSVVEAVDGKAGFDSAINIMPDIIISDLMMPVMDGIELCRKLKEDERTSHIPVILLSALAAIEDRIKGLETGADDYVAKPFNHAELQVRVQNLIDQRKVLFERFSNEIRLEASDIAASSVDVKFIDKLISIVERNMADPDLGVDQLTEELYLSRSQLHRKLKALTGQSATEFIRSIRLKRAARLFEQNTGSISETIYAVGFNNLSYFTRCFQRQFSLTPREYMKQFADKK